MVGSAGSASAALTSPGPAQWHLTTHDQYGFAGQARLYVNTQFNSVFVPVALAWKRSTGAPVNCPIEYGYEFEPPIAYDPGGDYVGGTERLFLNTGFGLNALYQISLDAQTESVPACPTQESVSGGTATATAHALQQSSGTLGPRWTTTGVTGAFGGSLKRTTKAVPPQYSPVPARTSASSELQAGATDPSASSSTE